MVYRMFTFQDDTITRHKLVNTFEEGWNEFDMNEFNFLPSFRVQPVNEQYISSLK